MSDSDEDIRTSLQDERTMLARFLTATRDVAVRRVEDLDLETARLVRAAPLTSLLGVVKHLTDVERWWFQDVWAGRDLEFGWSDEDPDGEWRIRDGDTVAGVVAAYRQAAADNDEILRTGNLDAVSARTIDGDQHRVNLRWVGWHLVEETARHNGHLDILRQQADGVTGGD